MSNKLLCKTHNRRVLVTTTFGRGEDFLAVVTHRTGDMSRCFSDTLTIREKEYTPTEVAERRF